MGHPVRFYSVTPEEFENLRKQMERGSDGEKEKQEQEQIRRDFENGIFFIEEEKNKENNNADERWNIRIAGEISKTISGVSEKTQGGV